MIPRQPWFERRFTFDLSPTLFPNVVERLRGTPARLEERVAHLSPATLTRRLGAAWSIQENVGHLLDLEPLWLERARQLRAGAAELVAADVSNRATHAGGHNSRRLSDLLRDFRLARSRLVELLESADMAFVIRAARHPRLGTPIRLIDLAFFVAEHDDHHLATISELLRRG
ncbi:MAG: DinB family protein [Gemmatimonadota bacterium]